MKSEARGLVFKPPFILLLKLFLGDKCIVKDTCDIPIGGAIKKPYLILGGGVIIFNYTC